MTKRRLAICGENGLAIWNAAFDVLEQTVGAWNHRRNVFGTYVVAAEAISPVATVYCDPAKDVTTPAPLAARVMAWPPAEVTTVAAEPPKARNRGSEVFA